MLVSFLDILYWANRFDYCQFSRTENSNGEIIELFAVGHRSVITKLSEVKKFSSKNRWLFGYLGYDLKNDFENLSSKNPVLFDLPNLFFFEPSYVFKRKEKGFSRVNLVSGQELSKDFFRVERVTTEEKRSDFRLPFDQVQYMARVEQIKQDIQFGNLYETNFCIPFSASDIQFDPVSVFLELDQICNAPFTSFLKMKHQYVLSFSPERFLKKEGLTLTSEPIKGTRKRGQTDKEDKDLMNELASDEKERSENVMIVDLVRNDLSKIAITNSVRVPELCKIYTFEGVHQMISRVECEISVACDFEEIVKVTFPMGSMTGAPKISAMKISEREEVFKRGVYSGAIGYIKPNADFDFNVVIRSVLYDSLRCEAHIPVGGAITIGSDPKSEFEECLTKTKLIRNYFKKRGKNDF